MGAAHTGRGCRVEVVVVVVVVVVAGVNCLAVAGILVEIGLGCSGGGVGYRGIGLGRRVRHEAGDHFVAELLLDLLLLLLLHQVGLAFQGAVVVGDVDIESG